MTLPFNVRWEAAPGGASGNAVHYAVMADRPPPGMWEPLRKALGRSRPCLLPDIPSSQCLREEGVYLSSERSVTINVLPPRFGAPTGLEDLHEITVIPLTADGRRIGEPSARVTIRVTRNPQT